MVLASLVHDLPLLSHLDALSRTLDAWLACRGKLYQALLEQDAEGFLFLKKLRRLRFQVPGMTREVSWDQWDPRGKDTDVIAFQDCMQAEGQAKVTQVRPKQERTYTCTPPCWTACMDTRDAAGSS